MENMATVIVAFILAVLVVFVIIKLVRDRKKGKNPCSFCPNSESCSFKEKEACKKAKNDGNQS